MNSVNRTLYIPLYGKAYVSRKGLFLQDKTAEQIWEAGGFPLRGKSKSKWLAYYMGIRSAVFDRWLGENMEKNPDAVVLHLGCGLDSRVLRVGTRGHKWFDVDFPEVIREREKYYDRSGEYRMVSGDLREENWLDALPHGGCAVVVLEGVSMYLTDGEREKLMAMLVTRFGRVHLLTDCYTPMAAKLSRYKNPINDVGVTEVYGLEDPRSLEGEGLLFVKEHDMTPPEYIEQLQGLEQGIFRRLYAGKFSKKLYRLYEYEKG